MREFIGTLRGFRGFRGVEGQSILGFREEHQLAHDPLSLAAKKLIHPILESYVQGV